MDWNWGYLGRRLAVVGLAFALIAGVATARTGHGAVGPRAAGTTLYLVAASCYPSTGEVAVGDGCYSGDSRYFSNVSQTGATYTVDPQSLHFRAVFTWNLPAAITGSGKVHLAVSATNITNDILNGYAASVCVDHTTFLSPISGRCATASAPVLGSTVSATQDVVLTVGNAPVGSDATVTLSFAEAKMRFTYAAVPQGPQEDPVARCMRLARGGARDRAHAAAINEVHVVDVKPDMQFHKGGTPADAWLPLEKDTVLKAGDEISADPDGAATLAFADNSTVVVRNTTQLKIGSFFTEGGVVRTEILLKMGEIAACINKSEATKSDFRITSPTGVVSVRGARDIAGAGDQSAVPTVGTVTNAFTEFYDPGSRTTLISSLLGTVSVGGPHRAPLSVAAGREVAFTPTSQTAVAPIGQAGARGGLDIRRARDLVLAVIASHNRACRTYTPRTGAFTLSPVRRGWRVSVKLTGRLHGVSKWSVIRGHVVPLNAPAKRLAHGC